MKRHTPAARWATGLAVLAALGGGLAPAAQAQAQAQAVPAATGKAGPVTKAGPAAKAAPAPAKPAAAKPGAPKPAPVPAAAAVPPAPPPPPPPPPLPPPPEHVRSLAGIQEYRLANGLQVLLMPDPSASTTTVNLTYKVGSRHEGQGEAGMAHLLEHLLFKDTADFSDLASEMGRRGMRFNGTTNADRTNYFASFNASEETLDFALRLEASRMTRSRLLAADLEKEMPVVRNELEIGENNTANLMRQRVLSAAYRFHPYAKPTIGTRSDLENVRIEQLRAFYQLHYQPDNAVLIITGQFEPEQALARVQASFGALPRPTRVLVPPYTVEPPQDGERTLALRRVGNGGSMLMTVWHVPATAHADCAALMALGTLLSQPSQGRLHQSLVESRLAGQVAANACGLHDPGLFTVVVAGSSRWDQATIERLMLDITEGRRKLDYTEAELKTAVGRLQQSFRQTLKAPDAAAAMLSESVAAGDWRLSFKRVNDLDRVTLDDLQRVTAAYLQPANRTLGRFSAAPKAEQVEVPLVPNLSAGLDELATGPDMAAGEAFVPTPAALESRTRRSTLPSGIRLAALNKATRGDNVTVSLRLRWAALPQVRMEYAAPLVAAVLAEGTTRRGRQQLLDDSSRLRGSFQISSGPQGAVVNLTAEKDTLLEMLALVREVLREPAYPIASFEQLRQRQIGFLQVGSTDPEALRAEAVREHYNRQRGLGLNDVGYIDSPRNRANFLRGVGLLQVREFHQRYWSANQMDVAAVGSLPEGLDAAIERLFGDWKKPEVPAYQRWTTPYRPVAAARFDAQADDKANAVLRMSQELKLSSLDADYPALQLANLMLGGGMDSRLFRRVRREEGLSYSVRSELQADPWDDSGSWSLNANYAPQNRERVLAALQEEVARLLDQGFDATELANARNNLLQGRQQQRSVDGQLAGLLLGQLETGQDWSQSEREDQARREVTLEQVNAAVRQHLQRAGWITSTAGDFRAKPPVAAAPGAASAP